MYSGILAKVKDTADTVGQKIQASVDAHGFTPINQPPGSQPSSRRPTAPNSPSSSPTTTSRRKRPEPLQIHTHNLTMEIAQLFMSMLHAWGLDPDLDKLCLNKLGILKPKFPVSFGLISREGHMSLMLPGWHKGVCVDELGLEEPIHTQTLMESTRTFQIKETEKMASRMGVVIQVLWCFIKVSFSIHV